MESQTTFGEVLRANRLERGIGLREFAAAMALKPSDVSRMEMNKVLPAAESEIVDMARYLHLDPDFLLACAGRIASDGSQLIRNHPREFATFIRRLRGRDRHLFDRDRKLAERNRWLKSNFVVLDQEHPRYD